MMCEEYPEIKLEDGATRIFLNTKGTDPTGVSDELIELLKYFETTTSKTEKAASSERIRKLQDKIDEIKSNEEIGERYMNLWEEIEIERQEAVEQEKKETALRMKEKGFDYKVIEEVTELSKEEIEKL